MSEDFGICNFCNNESTANTIVFVRKYHCCEGCLANRIVDIGSYDLKKGTVNESIRT